MATLDEQYTQIINEQRKHLAELQDAFNKQCDQISADAKTKIEGTATNEEKQKLLAEQKKLLDEELAKFKTDLETSNSITRKKLEEIHRQREIIKISELEKLIITL